MVSSHKYFHKTYLVLRVMLLILSMSFLAVACKPQEKISLPVPEIDCLAAPAEWMTLQPGLSTRQDVIDVLGKPDDKGKTKFMDGRWISYYAYNVAGGVVAEFVQHRIFFRSDGTIDWIEEIVGDGDGQLHTAGETVSQLGDTLDVVYNNSNYNPFAEFQYDILGGPDQIYVWSECGVALLALVGYKKTGPLDLEYSPVEFNDPQALKLRYPDIFHSEMPVKDLERVVLMKFLFQPTTFDSFWEHYMYRIPYGLWKGYPHKLEQK